MQSAATGRPTVWIIATLAGMLTGCEVAVDGAAGERPAREAGANAGAGSEGPGAAPPGGETPGAPPQTSSGVIHPGPEVFRIGNAVAPINYWMTAQMLNDIYLQSGFEDEIGNTVPSRGWHPYIEGQFGTVEQRRMVPMDAHGWPTSMTLSDGTPIDSLWSPIAGGSEQAGALPAGTYTMTWDGAASFEVMGATILTTEPGRMTLDYDGQSELSLSLLETDQGHPEGHLRNLSIMRPDADEGAFFDGYLDFVRPFTVIRPLHFLGEQPAYGPAFEWDERKPYDYSHWGGAMGAPYEAAIDLANGSDSDLWLNLPVAAGDPFLRELADLMLQRLDPARKLYLELGNEIWNFTYPYAIGRDYVFERAQERWPGVLGEVRPWSDGDEVDAAMMMFSWLGVRTVEACDIFRERWGDEAERLVCVAAGQVGASAPNYFPNRFILETPVYTGEEGGEPAGEHVDAFAIAAYLQEPEEIAFDRSSPEAFFADATDWLLGNGAFGEDAVEQGLRFLVRHDRRLADEFDLPLIAYEGGNHFIGSRYTRDVISNHPLMYDLYRDLFRMWREEGGGLFVHFAGIIPRGRNEPGEEPSYFQSENFGIVETLNQPLSESPKLRAVLDEMAGFPD